MCIGDWRVGRLIRSFGSVRAIALSSSIIIKANPQRVALTIGMDSSSPVPFNAVYLGIDQASLGVISLILMPYHITLATHGDLSTRQLTVTNTDPVNAVAVAIIEYTLPEEFLLASLAEFRRQYGLLPGP